MKIQTIIEEIKLNPNKLIHLQNENKLIRLINKSIILTKDPENLASILVNKYLGKYSVCDINALINTVKKAIDINSKKELTNEDLMHAENIILNILSKDPKTKIIELLKDIKVALSINSYDDELKKLIDSIKQKYIIDFESLDIDKRFKPKKKGFYITGEKNGIFMAKGYSNCQPIGYVLGWSENKLFFIGYKDGIIKQDYTRNEYIIKPIFIMLPGRKIIKKLDNKVLCKGVPISEIPDSLANEIIKKFTKDTKNIYLGASISAGDPRLLNGKVQLETMPISKCIDHLQARILITGRTGDGKTVWANIFQRQIMDNDNYLEGGVVSITRDVDNLSNAGEKFVPFSPNWDEDGKITNSFMEKVKLKYKEDFVKITISSDSYLPDINKLSKQTIFSMIDNSDCSLQVKIALKRHIEETDDIVNVFEKAKNGELLGEEYTSCQEDALRRLMNSLIPVNYASIKKIDLKKVLLETKNIGFFIRGLNSEVYGTMIVHELYNIQNDKRVRNPIKEGRLLMIDEVQKYVRYKAFKDIFEMCILDGRGFGIMLLGIIQSHEQAKKLCSYKDFILYHVEALEDGKRVITIDEKTAIIPPIAPEVA